MIVLFLPLTLLTMLPFCLMTVLEATGDYSGQHTDAMFLLGLFGGSLCVAGSKLVGPIVRKLCGLPPFGPLPAHQEQVITFNGSRDEAFQRATRAMRMVGKLTASDPVTGTIEGLRRWHPLSRGEHLRIHIRHASPEQSILRLESAPLRDSIETDEGSGAINVHILAREIITPTTHYTDFLGNRFPIEPRTSSA